MSVAVNDFWSLLAQSQLVAPEQAQALGGEFARVKGGAVNSNAKTITEWLISRHVLTRYQATVLLAGRPGPFVYGDYVVRERIEQGRLAGVFRAAHRGTSHPVLLHFAAGPLAQDPQQWAAAVRRVSKHVALVSPLLLRVYELVDLTAFKFAVTEDPPGQALLEQVASGRGLPPQEAARLVRLLALALAELHGAGLVHGDVRPATIWAEPGGSLCLLRDPLAAPQGLPPGGYDPSGQFAARSDYLAPELGQPGKAPEPLTDIYALGCTLYHLLAGRPPFAGGDPLQKLARHATEPIQPLEQFGVPQPLAQMTAYLMAKNPAVRYQQAAIVAEQLRAFVPPHQQEPGRAHQPPTQAAFEASLRAGGAGPAGGAAAPGIAIGPAAGRMSPPGPPVTGGRSPVGPAAAASSAAGNGAGGPSSALPGLAPKDEGSLAARRRAKKKPSLRNLIVTGASCGVAGLLLLIGFLVMQGMGGGTPAEDATADAVADAGPADVAETDDAAPADGDAPPPEVVGRYEVLPDNGRDLWAPPTAGEPLALDYLPPGAQAFLIVRPKDLLAAPHGEEVLEALGPEFAGGRSAWEHAAGAELGEIEQLVIGLYGAGGQAPRMAYVVHLAAARELDALRTAWGNPSPQEEDGEEYFTGPDYAYYAPAAAAGKAFVMGAPEEIVEGVKLAGAPPPPRRSVAELLAASDADRHLTVVFAPTFLTHDGQGLFTGQHAKLLPAMEWFLGSDLESVLFSAHCGDSLYLELRCLSAASTNRHQLATRLQERLKETPDEIENYIVALNPPTYWKKLALRYPQMIRFLHQYSRVGVDGDQAVVNCILPAEAAPNLALASELVAASAPGAAVEVGPAPAEGPQNYEELLAAPVTLVFDQDALDFAINNLQAEVNTSYPSLPFDFEIRILGDDLKLDGITQNQQIRDLRQEKQPLGDVLTAIVRKANPITTVTDASELDQKLIWVVGPDPKDAARTILLITTRAAAETKSYQLPPAFVPK